ncbi:DNA alkylation repair protein [Pseudactinotalea sp.]|uniref:DNA alkylation repair protein n=1 Tax=Pseudactinotalea sp. TaxID=1926260 RepID=UPI003B3A2659
MTTLVDRIRSELRALADPTIAPGQQAYMKSSMPFLGVRVPAVRALVKRQTRGLQDVQTLRAAALHLWRDARFREERYAATGVTGLPPLRARPDMLDVHEEMIRSGAWWDHVDEVAPRVGAALRAHPEEIAPAIRRWARDGDQWMRRTAIIAQLGFKEQTDRDLLTDVVLANVHDTEFFVRKAIGWALRDLAWHDADWVRRFVAAHELSPLSRREALKNVGGA